MGRKQVAGHCQRLSRAERSATQPAKDRFPLRSKKSLPLSRRSCTGNGFAAVARSNIETCYE